MGKKSKKPPTINPTPQKKHRESDKKTNDKLVGQIFATYIKENVLKKTSKNRGKKIPTIL